MKDDQFDAAVAEHIASIETLPEEQRERLMEIVEETRRRHANLKQIEKRARDSLDDWRLILKYNMFNDEAKRREAQRRNDSGQE